MVPEPGDMASRNHTDVIHRGLPSHLVSAFPGIRGLWTARSAVVVATVVASILTSTEVVGLDPSPSTATPASVPTTVVATVPDPVVIAAAATRPALTSRNIPCDTDLGPCDGDLPALPPPPDVVASCAAPGNHAPTGDTDVVAATGEVPDGAVRLRVEVERGLAIDSDCFAAEVIEILNDERGWGVNFALVDGDDFDLRLVLASPATTDALCYPSKTNGIYSCRSGNRVTINVMRWESATDDYAEDLSTYRQYLINHEVGHFLGRGHVSCPGTGEPAPVMMQQTKGLGECSANGWPTDSELAGQ